MGVLNRMAETLGSLCDKLTVVKLKQWHADDAVKLESLSVQERQLQNEINEFAFGALSGAISVDRLTFPANKVFKASGNAVKYVTGSLGEVVSHLSVTNCSLWHEQEKVYDFENVPVEQKDCVVKHLALLNLERTKCIDEIDRQFCKLISEHLFA
jgi:hypothetical protein